MTCLTGSKHFLKYGRQSSSNLALVRFKEKSSPFLRASTSIVVYLTVDKILLDFSQAVLSLLMAFLSPLMSIPVVFKNY